MTPSLDPRIEQAIDEMERKLGRRFGSFSRRELLRPILSALVESVERGTHRLHADALDVARDEGRADVLRLLDYTRRTCTYTTTDMALHTHPGVSAVMSRRPQQQDPVSEKGT